MLLNLTHVQLMSTLVVSAGVALDPREPDVEEGADVVDGDARRLQDGPPHAHLPVLHPHGTHLTSGRTTTNWARTL